LLFNQFHSLLTFIPLTRNITRWQAAGLEIAVVIAAAYFIRFISIN
jgi:hypothetical protein